MLHEVTDIGSSAAYVATTYFTMDDDAARVRINTVATTDAATTTDDFDDLSEWSADTILPTCVDPETEPEADQRTEPDAEPIDEPESGPKRRISVSCLTEMTTNRPTVRSQDVIDATIIISPAVQPQTPNSSQDLNRKSLSHV